MSGETREEICNAILYGSKAWRFIRIRQLLGEWRRQVLNEGKGWRPDYLSAGWAAMQAGAKVRPAEVVKAVEQLRNKLYAKNGGKPPPRREWQKENEKLLRRLRPPDASPSTQWMEATDLWRELLQRFETALLIGDDDWLDDLAKAIRGEAQPEQSAEFTTKVLVLLQKKAGATARDIFAALGSKKSDGRLKVAGRVFENKQRALEAIRDVSKKVNHELARKQKLKNLSSLAR